MAASAEKHAQLMAAMELGERGHEHAPLIKFAGQHRMVDSVLTLPRAQHESFFSLLHEHLAFTLQSAALTDESHTSQQRTDTIAALTALASAVGTAVTACTNADGKGKTKAGTVLSTTLFQSLQLFHDSLLSLPHPECSSLQNTLSLLFEKVFSKQMTVRASVAVPDAAGLTPDQLLPMTLSYLLLRCLEVGEGDEASGGGKKSDIIRLYAMRQGLTLFDYEDESSDGIKQLLIRCMMHPLFLRSLEGRRFLSFILVGLGVGGGARTGTDTNGDMMRLLHEAIKHQLPLSKATFIPLYADVYLRAWKLCGNDSASSSADASTAGGQQQSLFETCVIQDLMYLAVHSASPKTSRALHSLLSQSFHDPAQKKLRGVEGMLTRLWEPILWRGLKAANALVRRNATLLFIDVFPLIHPDEGGGGGASRNASSSSSSFPSNDALLQYQFDSLLSLVHDEDPSVRLLGVAGIAKILNAFWELLPLPVSRKLVATLTGHCLSDAGAGGVAVRVAVFQGLGLVLQNVLSHTWLKAVLPSTATHLFDASEAVQIAFVDMLHIIKRTRGMKYYDVAPIEQIHLAIQLATSTKLSTQLLALLLNSYFPNGKPMESTLARCLTLLRSNASVFGKLCASLHRDELQESGLTPDRRVQFVAALFTLVGQNVRKQRSRIVQAIAQDKEDAAAAAGSKSKKGSKAKSSPPSSAASNDPLYLDVLNVPLFDTLLSSIVILYRNLPTELLEEDEALASTLLGAFMTQAGGIGDLLATLGTRSASARLSLIHLSALLPDECSPDLREISLPHLLELGPPAPHAEWAPLLECMVSWERTSEVMQHIHRSVTLALSSKGEEYFEARSGGGGGEEEEVRQRGDRTRARIEEEFHAHYQREHATLLPAAGKSKKGAARDAANSAPLPLLHPLMALKYLAYLLEHDKTRSKVLALGVEWSQQQPVSDDDGASSSAARGGGGRAVGFLAAIMAQFNEHLIPACKVLVEDTDSSVTATAGQRAHMSFLHAAIQADLKTSLHIHARIKLLAQRADQMAAEAAEAAATAALAVAEDAADIGVGISAIVSGPSAVSQVPAFPESVQNILDFTTYILLPHWAATVDRQPVDDVKGSDEARKEQEDAAAAASASAAEEAKEDVDESAASNKKKRGGKKSKPTRSAADSAAAAAAAVPPSISSGASSPLASIGAFLSSHLLFVARFSTELLTLGYFTPEYPLTHFQQWMRHFVDMAAAAAAAAAPAPPAVEDLKEKTKKTTKQHEPALLFKPHTSEFVCELLPMVFKALYHLSVVAADTRNFGAAPEDALSSSSTQHLTFHAYASFWRNAVTLLACAGEQGATLLASSPLLKAGVVDSLAQFDRMPAAQARVLWTALEALVDDERYALCATAAERAQLDWLLPREPIDSTATLPPYALLLLTSVSRSPACVSVLPRMLDQLAERLAVHAPPNERTILERLGAALSALGLLADVHVKMQKKRHTFLSTLLTCTDHLSALSASLSIVPPASSDPLPLDSPARSPARPAASSPAVDDGGVAAMELDDGSSERPPLQEEHKSEQQGSPPHLPATPSASGQKKKRTPRKGTAAAARAPDAAATDPPAIWTALKSKLATQMAALEV